MLKMQEVEVLSTLRHPNIVEFHEAFFQRSGRQLCIVMAYCESGDLRKEISAAQKAGVSIPEERVMGEFRMQLP